MLVSEQYLACFQYYKWVSALSQPVSLPSDLVVSLAKQLKDMDTNPASLQMIDTFLNAVPKDLSRPRTNIDDFRQLLDELSPSGLTRHQL